MSKKRSSSGRLDDQSVGNETSPFDSKMLVGPPISIVGAKGPFPAFLGRRHASGWSWTSDAEALALCLTFFGDGIHNSRRAHFHAKSRLNLVQTVERLGHRGELFRRCAVSFFFFLPCFRRRFFFFETLHKQSQYKETNCGARCALLRPRQRRFTSRGRGPVPVHNACLASNSTRDLSCDSKSRPARR